MWACFTSVGVVGETDAAVYSKKKEDELLRLAHKCASGAFGLMMIIRWKKKKKKGLIII